MRLFRNKFAVVWLIGLTATSVFWVFTLLAGTDSGINRLNTLVFDTYQRIKPREWSGSDVVIIDIDEASIERLGQWPWPRTVVAELTDKLGELGAAAIVFDVVFSEPDRTSPVRAVDDLRKAGAKVSLPSSTALLDFDAVLAKSFERNTVVTGLILSRSGTKVPPVPKAGTGLSGTFPPQLMAREMKAIRNLPDLDSAATGIGEFSFSTESQSDAVVRRTTLIKAANDQYYPSLAMETLRVVQGAGSFKIKSSDGSGEFGGGELAIVSAKVGALEVFTDKSGALDIYHSPVAVKPIISAQDVLFPKASGLDSQSLTREIANHIVLIGTSAAGLLDLRATPLQSVVPGVTIHAEIIDQIISGTFLSRPDVAPGFELFVALIAVFVLLFLLPRLKPLGDGLAAVGLAALVLMGFWIAFSQYNLLLSPVVPILSIALAYAAGVGAELLVTEKQSRFVRSAFSHYLSPEMVNRLAENPEALTLGGEDKELTILFCDIRGFTSLSEGLDPTELTNLLNNFLTPMTTELLDRGATIDKYMGDAIMAFWNAPIDQDDHEQRACDGVLAMREALKTLNDTSSRPIHIGVGLNTGASCVGNLGSTQRFNYSAIGDAVNVASRVEGLTKFYGLDNLVASETLNKTEGFATLEVDSVAVVGRQEPLTVHTLIGGASVSDDDQFLELYECHTAMLDAYRAGDAEEGIVAMAKAGRLSQSLQDVSLMKLYALYGERFASLRDNGIPENWDGVFRATSK